MRLPVAAKIAVQIAGAIGGTPGSPTPPRQASGLWRSRDSAGATSNVPGLARDTPDWLSSKVDLQINMLMHRLARLALATHSCLIMW
jgi:hypothetical protein